MSLSVSPAAFVSDNAYIAGVLDYLVPPRLYTVNSWTGGSTTAPPTGATPEVNPMFGAFPQVASVSLVAAGDGVNNQQVGWVKLNLAPAAGDVVSSSSPDQLVLSPNALVIVASTATG